MYYSVELFSETGVFPEFGGGFCHQTVGFHDTIFRKFPKKIRIPRPWGAQKHVRNRPFFSRKNPIFPILPEKVAINKYETTRTPQNVRKMVFGRNFV